MLNLAFKGMTLIRQGCLLLSPFISAKHLAKSIDKKIELDRQDILYHKSAVFFDKTEEQAQNSDDIKNQALKVALFGYASYRVLSGEESPIEFALSSGATALMLYPHAQKLAQTVMQNNTVAHITEKVFSRVNTP